MKLIDSKTVINNQQGYDYMSIRKFITQVAYTCYKTEKEITDEVANEFIAMLINRKHFAMLEHGTVYLTIPYYGNEKLVLFYLHNPYSILTYDHNTGDTIAYISTNYRIIVENGRFSDLDFLSEPTKYHAPRYSVKFICDRGVSHELVRHRVMSFAQESTRYCNYSKDKFGNEVTFIKPSWYDSVDEPIQDIFIQNCKDNEEAYLTLLGNWDNRKPDRRYKTGFKGNPLTPQQARQVLSNALKTEIYLTGFKHQWEHFFDLRALDKTGPAHPDMAKLCKPLYQEFIENKYL